MIKHSDKKEISTKKLINGKLKITPQRIAILSQLIDNYDHPTADTIYQKVRQKLPNISFDTVNRTLSCFVQSGVIKRAEGLIGSRRYDPMISAHHHFHCVMCNKIIDFISKDHDNIRLPESITSKHQILDRKIVLDGICENCKKLKIKNN